MAPTSPCLTVTLHSLVGHDDARASVFRALTLRTLPSVMLLHGPKGVGKQRFALWVGQLLLCDFPEASDPCGECKGCRMTLRLEHPDLLWYVPISKPPARGSPERDCEALEETRIEFLERIREDPLRPFHTGAPKGLHLGTIRNLLREAGKTPAMGGRRLFLIGDAENLVSQESSPEAANALLKLLEEPPNNTWFILTASNPGRLLETIRSRSTTLRLSPLPIDAVYQFIERETTALPEALKKAATMSGGCIGQALGLLPDGPDPGPFEVIRQQSFHLLRAALEPGGARRFTTSLSFAPSGARGLDDLLMALEGWLRDLAVAATGEESTILNQDAREWLVRQASAAEIHPLRIAQAFDRIEAARTQAAGNVNPQLVIAGLLVDLNQRLAASTTQNRLTPS